ncbi:hypothetical protein [Burkholderia multivorans]|uniref:hypothetical protein n=1 Tax=Burkholderia multivorans TaxID=87883 RepID=UPI0021BE1208|nr:hypothetical protein [Burkholderia multivorans]
MGGAAGAGAATAAAAQASGQGTARAERAAGADGRPAAGGRGTRAVLRLPVARIAVQPAAASHHT